MGTVEYRAQVGLNALLPLARVHFSDPAEYGDPGAIDHVIEAVQFPIRERKEAAHILRLRSIGGDAAHLASRSSPQISDSSIHR
jgi:hypothetical protein